MIAAKIPEFETNPCPFQLAFILRSKQTLDYDFLPPKTISISQQFNCNEFSQVAPLASLTG
jgi:hypothetical protein